MRKVIHIRQPGHYELSTYERWCHMKRQVPAVVGWGCGVRCGGMN